MWKDIYMNSNFIAPCGVDCVNCDFFYQNCTPAFLERMATAAGKTPSELVCKGCREQGGCPLTGTCDTLACIRQQGKDFCYECDRFPCERLLPAKDKADKLPHNLKVYNLCRIKAVGLSRFIEEAKGIRDRYFNGSMIIGKGPQLPDDM